MVAVGMRQLPVIGTAYPSVCLAIFMIEGDCLGPNSSMADFTPQLIRERGAEVDGVLGVFGKITAILPVFVRNIANEGQRPLGLYLRGYRRVVQIDVFEDDIIHDLRRGSAPKLGAIRTGNLIHVVP